MKINENIAAIDLAIYLEKLNTLILSDLHLGFEKELHARGILIPPFQFKEIKSRLENIFNKILQNASSRMPQAASLHKFKKIIINGDLKHEFGRISNQEWGEILELIDFLSLHTEKIVIIQGQHDIILDRITNKKNILIENSFFRTVHPVAPTYGRKNLGKAAGCSKYKTKCGDVHNIKIIKTGIKLNDIYITHGHKIPETKEFENSKIIIIGNEHPAVSISDGIRAETYKCFLKGSFRDKVLIVQPSFCLVTEGTNILKEQVISPFLQNVNLSNFEVFVLAPSFNEIKYFGKIRDL